ncbi:MAG: hypothetical protein R6X22_01490 [Gemmatimonadota bacterium]|jgi:hypothetical protein
MLSLIGLPLVVAAWALPAFFVLLLAGMFAWAGLGPAYRAWTRLIDVAIGAIARVGLRAASGMAAVAYEQSSRHPARRR